MITNTNLIKLNCYNDKYGYLVPVESEESIPFSLKRIYYIYGVESGMRRGFHSHKDLEQALICVHGSVKIHLRTPFQSEDILLDSPTTALYIGPMIWREMYDFSEDAVLLVLANKHYDINDYIRDYTYYEKISTEYFLNLQTQNGGSKI